VAIVPVREGVFVRLLFGALAGAVSVLISASTLAQAPPESKSEATPPERTAIELFKAPHPKRIDMERFPLSETGNEGWVELAFMVDTSGKPFEVTVVRSTGNPTFEKIAMKSMEHSTFEPGKLNGAPVESGFEMKYLFADERMRQSPGANPAFIKSYKALIAALDSGERATAAEAMQKLKITNLYEDAYFGMATYHYASKYGDERQQLEGLRRAIAREDYARYLPRDLFRFALINCMQLEVKDHQYAEALATWKRLQKAGIDKDSAARIREAVAKLERFVPTTASTRFRGRYRTGTGTCICSSDISKPWSQRDTSLRCGLDAIHATGFFRLMQACSTRSTARTGTARSSCWAHPAPNSS
jgi:TonB family protein